VGVDDEGGGVDGGGVGRMAGGFGILLSVVRCGDEAERDDGKSRQRRQLWEKGSADVAGEFVGFFALERRAQNDSKNGRGNLWRATCGRGWVLQREVIYALEQDLGKMAARPSAER